MKIYPIVVVGAEDVTQRRVVRGRRYMTRLDWEYPGRLISIDSLAASTPLWEGAAVYDRHSIHKEDWPRTLIGIVTNPVWDDSNWRLCAWLLLRSEALERQIDELRVVGVTDDIVARLRAAGASDADIERTRAEGLTLSYEATELETHGIYHDLVKTAKSVDPGFCSIAGGRFMQDGEPFPRRGSVLQSPAWLRLFQEIMPPASLHLASMRVTRLIQKQILEGVNVDSELAPAQEALVREKREYTRHVDSWIAARATT